jgi:predicted Na+-dependent transporter
MGPLDAIWHLFNFLLAPVGLGLIAASLCKLAWWRPLRAVRWRQLALPAAGAAVLIQIIFLVWLERDGRMSTYAAQVVGVALVLWWTAFGPRRRRPSVG